MNIAIDCRVLENKNWSGKENVLYEFVKSLFIIDQENKYYLYFHNNPQKELCGPDNFTPVYIKAKSPFWQLAVLFDLLVKKIDLLIETTSYLLPAINFFTKNIIVIHDLVSFLPELANNHKKEAVFKEKLFLKQAIKNSIKIVTVSNNTKEDVVKIFKVAPSNILVSYPGVANKFNIKDKNKCLEELSEYDLPNDYILFVGTLEPRKNINNLILAFAKVKCDKYFDDVKLVIVGKKGWYYENIFELIKSLNLSNDIIFVGYVPDDKLPYFYNLAKIFVYPSNYEGFGIPVLEAMNCGVPVISSNISSIPEILGDSGVLINPLNVDGISQAISFILTNDKIKEEIIVKQLAKAKSFSYGGFTKGIVGIFKDIL